MNTKRKALVGLALVGAVALSLLYFYGRSYWVPVYQKVAGKETVASVYGKYGERSEKRLIPYFEDVGIEYPPKRIKLLAVKDEKRLELWASNGDGFKRIKDYGIRATSGVAGPKLIEGDGQVPEGIYNTVGLNPNSSYHLSIMINYPNAYDLEHAKNEGRNKPGTNIFIHGKAVSIGCLAMGDRAIEELFSLVHKSGLNNAKVIIAPSDPRKATLMPPPGYSNDWIPELYQNFSNEFMKHREI